MEAGESPPRGRLDLVDPSRPILSDWGDLWLVEGGQVEHIELDLTLVAAWDGRRQDLSVAQVGGGLAEQQTHAGPGREFDLKTGRYNTTCTMSPSGDRIACAPDAIFEPAAVGEIVMRRDPDVPLLFGCHSTIREGEWVTDNTILVTPRRGPPILIQRSMAFDPRATPTGTGTTRSAPITSTARALGAWAHDNGNLALTDPDGDDVLWVCVSGGDSTWDCDSERADLPPLHLSSQLVAECA